MSGKLPSGLRGPVTPAVSTLTKSAFVTENGGSQLFVACTAARKERHCTRAGRYAVLHCHDTSCFHTSAYVDVRSVSKRGAVQQRHRSAVVILVESFHAVVEGETIDQRHVVTEAIGIGVVASAHFETVAVPAARSAALQISIVKCPAFLKGREHAVGGAQIAVATVIRVLPRAASVKIIACTHVKLWRESVRVALARVNVKDRNRN